MHKGRSENVFIITVIACVMALMMDSLAGSVDLSHLSVVMVLFGILIILCMVYEELKS